MFPDVFVRFSDQDVFETQTWGDSKSGLDLCLEARLHDILLVCYVFHPSFLGPQAQFVFYDPVG